MPKKVIIDWKVLDAILQFKPSREDCCSILNCSDTKLETSIRKKYDMTFREYRNFRMGRTRVKLAQKQFDVAMSGNTTMLIWLGKNWLGQKDLPDDDEDCTLVFE